MRKNIKTYQYKFKYIKYLSIIKNNINFDDDSIINITINNNVDVKLECDGNIFKYSDDGKTSIYLKGLGKVFLISEISLYMESGLSFKVTDDKDNTYGISKIRTLDNDFLIIGGYDNWSEMITIDKRTSINDVIIKFLNYINEFGFANFKSMYILINKDVAKNVDNKFYEKPYLYIID